MMETYILKKIQVKGIWNAFTIYPLIMVYANGFCVSARECTFVDNNATNQDNKGKVHYELLFTDVAYKDNADGTK